MKAAHVATSSQPVPWSTPDPASRPRVWILRSTGAGDNRQLSSLATALGWPCEVKHTVDSLPRVLTDRLHKPGRSRVPARKHDRLRPPWPDLVLVSGGRCVTDALRIKAESGGRSRVVCLGRPWAPLAWFDLVVTTPQYRLPERPGVIQTLLPLNRLDPASCAAAGREWEPRLSHLPRPWIGVLLGGDSGSYHFTRSAARELGRQIDDQARSVGGALLISSSARTPPRVLDALLAELQAPHYCHRWHAGGGDNPLDAILSLADGFVVTADSASMLAEACATGRAVVAFAPPLRWRARLLTRARLPDWPGREALLRLRRRLVSRGLWIPARDMSRLHAALQARGIIRPMAELGGRAQALHILPDDMERVVTSIGALFSEAADLSPASRSRGPSPHDIKPRVPSVPGGETG